MEKDFKHTGECKKLQIGPDTRYCNDEADSSGLCYKPKVKHLIYFSFALPGI